MARFKEVELKRHGCVSLVSRMYPDDTLFDYVVYVTNEEAYKLGNQHGLEYKVKRTDLLENKKHGSAAT